MSTPWEDVEGELLDRVFYAWPPADVRAAPDLAAAGMVDSLSVVAVLEVLVGAAGDDTVLEISTADDFRNLDTIRQLYQRR